MDAEAGKTGKCCCNKPTHRRSGEAPEAHAEQVGTSALSTFSAPWIVGRLATAVGEVPQVATSLTWRDRLGAWRVRWAIGRMRYRIPAGLYAVGNPNDESPVLVTANYKLTFDCLRSQMADRDAWILVLDTKGVNVWCAAAKGTFGTDELVHRIEATRVASVVSHDMLIVPQLAAVGVTAHEVHKRSGFRVMFGPVYASDIPAFLDAGFKSPEMRFVRFPLRDRLALVPVELVQWAKKVLIVAVCLLLLAGLGSDGYPDCRSQKPSRSCAEAPAFTRWEPHLHPTSPRFARTPPARFSPEAPAFTRWEVHLHPTSPRFARTPPAHFSPEAPAFTRWEVHLHPTHPRAPRALAPPGIRAGCACWFASRLFNNSSLVMRRITIGASNPSRTRQKCHQECHSWERESR